MSPSGIRRSRGLEFSNCAQCLIVSRAHIALNKTLSLNAEQLTPSVERITLTAYPSISNSWTDIQFSLSSKAVPYKSRVSATSVLWRCDVEHPLEVIDRDAAACFFEPLGDKVQVVRLIDPDFKPALFRVILK
jgi:hypothetical protein